MAEEDGKEKLVGERYVIFMSLSSCGRWQRDFLFESCHAFCVSHFFQLAATSDQAFLFCVLIIKRIQAPHTPLPLSTGLSPTTEDGTGHTAAGTDSKLTTMLDGFESMSINTTPTHPTPVIQDPTTPKATMTQACEHAHEQTQGGKEAEVIVRCAPNILPCTCMSERAS